jgi:ubiquinone/menaquinone biosynthesis C-methylase UbiE
MAHKFHPEDKAKLDREERKRAFPADAALGVMDLDEGSIVADIGCGTGYLAIPAARAVGGSGRIFAVDSSSRMLSEFVGRMEAEKLGNVTTVLSTEYDFRIEPSLCTHVVMSSVFHEVDDRVKFAGEALRILKPGGMLVVFEFNPGVDGPGPPEHHRLASAAVERALVAAGFGEVSTDAMNEFVYWVIGRRGNGATPSGDRG